MIRRWWADFKQMVQQMLWMSQKRKEHWIKGRKRQIGQKDERGPPWVGRGKAVRLQAKAYIRKQQTDWKWEGVALLNCKVHFFPRIFFVRCTRFYFDSYFWFPSLRIVFLFIIIYKKKHYRLNKINNGIFNERRIKKKFQ